MKLWTTVLLLACTSVSVAPQSTASSNSSYPEVKSRHLDIAEFTSILFSEVPADFGLLSEDDLRSADYWWDKATDFQWRILFERGIPSTYIICSTDTALSGHGRRDALKAAVADAAVVSGAAVDGQNVTLRAIHNADKLSCYFVNLDASTAASVEATDGWSIVLQPLMLQMKLPMGTLQLIQDLYAEWQGNDNATSQALSTTGNRLRRTANSTSLSSNNKYVVSADVTLCPGTGSDLLDIVRSGNGDLDQLNEDIVQNLTDYLLAVHPDTNKSIVQESFFWAHSGMNRTTDANASSSGFIASPPRAAFWQDLLDNGLDSIDRICDDALTTGSAFNITIRPPTDPQNCSVCTTEFTMDIFLNNMEKDCALSILAGMALHPSTCSVRVRRGKLEMFNAQAQWLTQTGVDDVTPFYDVGIDGTGQVVAVSDTGLDIDNCYFWDSTFTSFVKDGSIDLSGRKVVQYVPYGDSLDDEGGHGTHVSGTIVGHRAVDGLTESKGVANGIAYGAKLAFFDLVSSSDDSLQAPTGVLSAGRPYAKVHSISWGNPGDSSYGVGAVMIDEYLYDNLDFLVVTAVGNSGDNNAFGTITDPATSKNSIGVGASHSYGSDLAFGERGPSYISSFSSKGPTEDGRTKPDIVAPGHFILSAGAKPNQIGECDPYVLPGPDLQNEGVASKSGTSMATPVVAGTALLVRQYFEDGYYPTGAKVSSNSIIPSGALVKAVLMNGAQYVLGVDNGGEVYDTRPYDQVQNFGRVSLVDSLYLADKSNVQVRVWDDVIIQSTSSDVTFDLTIDSSGGCTSTGLSATLVWMDPPASSGCTRCLLNDLDLYAVKNGDTSNYYFPNGLDSRDSVNNAERVQIQDLVNGDVITLTVRAHNLDTSYATAALVATGCFGGTGNSIDMTKSVYQGDDNQVSRFTRSFFTKQTLLIILAGGVAAFVFICFLNCVFSTRSRRKR